MPIPAERLDHPPTGYRQRSIGEVIRAGDYMRIGSGLYLLGERAHCVGNEIDDGTMRGHLEIWTAA